MKADILTRHDVGVPERTARPVHPTHRGAGELDFSRTVEGPEASQLARLAAKAGLSLSLARGLLRELAGRPASWWPALDLAHPTSAAVTFAHLVYALPEDERAALLASV